MSAAVQKIRDAAALVREWWSHDPYRIERERDHRYHLWDRRRWDPVLACPQGNVDGSHPLVHRFTTGQVERIVYALSAAYADAAISEADDPDGDAYAIEPCPVDVLTKFAGDPEMYSEHVDSSVEQRRAAGGAA